MMPHGGEQVDEWVGGPLTLRPMHVDADVRTTERPDAVCYTVRVTPTCVWTILPREAR